MNTNRLIQLAAVTFSLAVFPNAGCAEKEKPAETVSPAAKAETTASPTTGAAVPAAATADTAIAKWSDIKDLTFDTRAQFFTGLKRLEARVDEQISELTARRAAMTSTANTKDWDFAMKEMGNARSYLKGMGEDLAKATPETWSQQKENVGQAWVRTQNAYAKVKASTTN